MSDDRIQGVQARSGTATVNIHRVYDEWAQTYDSDRNLTRDLDREVTRAELGGLHCRVILELGCGTGKNTPFLASISQEVHAIDISEGMISRARTRPGLENVRFSLADIRRPWPAEDHSVDLVVCNLVLEHVEDLHSVFSESSRALVKGGRFFVCELHPFRQYQGTRARFHSSKGEQEIAAFVHHVSDYSGAAAECGFDVEHLKEWWHEEDGGTPPRLISFMFCRRRS